MDPINPSAQGPQSGAEVPVDQQPTQQAAPQVPAGFQERIDQLTAQIYELRGQNQQQQSHMVELMRIAQQQAAPPPSPSVPGFQLPDDLDPTLKHVLTAQQMQMQQMMKAQQDALAAQQAQLAAQTKALQVQQQLALVAPPGTPPEVLQRAQQLAQQWAGTAVMQHATPQDILAFAFGHAAMGNQQRTQTSRDALGRFNSQAQVMTQQSVPPAAVPQNRPAAVELPAGGFNSPQEAAAAAAELEKRLGDTAW